ncbi:hypothetical protein PYW08_016225 [Mythimna loreyi]|uniref:Uncharacterized protein n=1 Tax=Mythimna loreyi TaxID=667449 RepID=A0ACC2QWF4_9NEOP|nr:hypothetical protein PYW08_016225 [Mythimna loreyi]
MYFSSRTYHTNMLKAYYFICLSILLILTDRARCDSDYLYNHKAGGWLKLYTAPQAWEQAFLKCDQDGAVLASPLNKELVNALQLQMLQFGVSGNIFLGTHDLFSKGHFVSIEGVTLSDMDIKWAQGDGAGTGDCLTMSVDGSVHFSSCTDRLPFVCYRKPETQTMNDCSTYDFEYHLNEQTGSCYKVHLNKQTWTRAYSICASEGGHLVILNDEEEVRIVQSMISTPYDQFNVGLVAWGNDRTWKTIHGDKIDDVYNQWNTGEPNNENHIENRGACLSNGKLNDFPAVSYSLIFVCEKSPYL